jgi:hypothetical protein
MKNKLILSCLAAAILAKTTTAQIKVSEVSGGYITGNHFGPQATLANYKKLAPNSDSLNAIDPTKFNNSNQYYSPNDLYENGFRLQVGLSLPNKKHNPKFDRTLRLGIKSQTMGGNYLNLSNTNSYRIDTLVSTQTGSYTYIDSTFTNTAGVSWYAKNVSIDAQMVWRTKFKGYINGYAGIGGSIGKIYQQQLQISKYSYSNFTNFAPQNYNLNSQNTYRYTTEQIDNNSSYNAQLYVPFGIDLRASKKDNFFGHLHLFMEGNVGISTTKIGTMGSYTGNSFSYSQGLRYTW